MTAFAACRPRRQRALENADLCRRGHRPYHHIQRLPDTITLPSAACCQAGDRRELPGAGRQRSACAGFLYALDLPTRSPSRQRQRVLVVCAEGMTRMVDWTDRSTCVLFGDGAGAAVVDGGEGGLMATLLTSQGDATHLNMCPDPGNSPSPRQRSRARLAWTPPEITQVAVSPVGQRSARRPAEKAGVALTTSDLPFCIRPTGAIIDAARAPKQPSTNSP